MRGDCRFPVLAAHVLFRGTYRPWDGRGRTPLLGIHDGRAYALLYNGILGDKRPDGGNVLTRATLALLRAAIARTHPRFARESPGRAEERRVGNECVSPWRSRRTPHH